MNANGLCRSAPCPSSAAPRPPPLLPSMMSILSDVIAAAACKNIFLASFRVGQRRRVLGREGRSELSTSFECPPHRERSHVLGNAHWRTTTQHETPLSPTAADKKSRRVGREGFDVRMCPMSMWKLAIERLASRHSFKCHFNCNVKQLLRFIDKKCYSI